MLIYLPSVGSSKYPASSQPSTVLLLSSLRCLLPPPADTLLQRSECAPPRISDGIPLSSLARS